MENSIGKVTINKNKKQKITNDDIKRMKEDRNKFQNQIHGGMQQHNPHNKYKQPENNT